MSDQVGTPEDQFSRVTAHMVFNSLFYGYKDSFAQMALSEIS